MNRNLKKENLPKRKKVRKRIEENERVVKNISGSLSLASIPGEVMKDNAPSNEDDLPDSAPLNEDADLERIPLKRKRTSNSRRKPQPERSSQPPKTVNINTPEYRQTARRIVKTLKSFGYQGKIKGNSLVIYKSKTMQKILSYIFLILVLAFGAYQGYNYFMYKSFNLIMITVFGLLLILSILFLYMIKPEQVVLNRKLKTVRDINKDTQVPYKFLFPLKMKVIQDNSSKNIKNKLFTIVGKNEYIPLLKFDITKLSKSTIDSLKSLLEKWIML